MVGRESLHFKIYFKRTQNRHYAEWKKLVFFPYLMIQLITKDKAMGYQGQGFGLQEGLATKGQHKALLWSVGIVLFDF